MDRALVVLETPADREKACRWVMGVSPGSRVEFKAPKRSLPQNDKLWALLTEVKEQMDARGIDYSTDQWKVVFLHAWGREVQFLPAWNSDKTFVPYGQSSSDLSKEEMSSFIEFIIAQATLKGLTVNTHDNSNPGASSPSAQPVDGAEVSPPASAPSSITSEMQKHFCDFTRKGLSTIRDSRLSEGDTMAVILLMAQLYTEEFGEDVTPMLDKVMAAMKAVNEGKRTEEQAIEFISRELGCSADELKGRSK